MSFKLKKRRLSFSKKKQKEEPKEIDIEEALKGLFFALCPDLKSIKVTINIPNLELIRYAKTALNSSRFYTKVQAIKEIEKANKISLEEAIDSFNFMLKERIIKQNKDLYFLNNH